MNNNTLIISMTSYPARINGVASVWKSILDQTVPRDKYHCVLVLAEPEFPNKKLPEELQSLINNKSVELIWYPRNILSHKKLMPVLAKYPDNPILVTDDDIRREKTWVEMFMKDHEEHPNDIIAGAYSYYFDEKLELKRFTDAVGKNAGGKNHIPSMVLNFTRPANGCAGTLYPAHTFTDKRFFDEEAMMRLSKTSDESWQYCFNIICGKTFRQTSEVRDHSLKVVPGTQQMSTALYKANRSKYPVIFKNLMEAYPEFKENLIKNQRKCIISLTSYPRRYEKLPQVLDSLLNQTIKASKIVLTLTKDDAEKLTPEIKAYINSDKVELLIAKEDIKPHKKYFYAMQKYQDYAVITVDDDFIYSNTMVETLLNGYWKHPNCVIARRVHKMLKDKNGKLKPYSQWVYECKTMTGPSSELFATGGAGALYPPNILNLSEKNLPLIKETMNADDVYLKHVETGKGIKVVFVKDKADKPISDDVTQSLALYKTNCHGGNDKYIKNLQGKKKKEQKPTVKKKKIEKKPVIQPKTEKVVEKKKINLKKERPSGRGWTEFFGLS